MFVLAPGAAVLADPASPLAPAIEAASTTANGVIDTAAESASDTTESVTETVEDTTETVTETVAEATEAVTETVGETAEAVADTAADTVGSVVETASDASQTAEGTATGGGDSVDAPGGAAAAPAGTAVDPTTPRSGAAGSDDHQGTASSDGQVTAGTQTGPAAGPGASGPLGAGPVVDDVRGVGGSVSWFVEGGSVDAALRLGPSGDTESTCETNLHRGVETAIVPCSAGASVLGVTLGVTGVAVLSLLFLAFALGAVGTGALAVERRLQRG
jgi:hypothetical protein